MVSVQECFLNRVQLSLILSFGLLLLWVFIADLYGYEQQELKNNERGKNAFFSDLCGGYSVSVNK